VVRCRRRAATIVNCQTRGPDDSLPPLPSVDGTVSPWCSRGRPPIPGAAVISQIPLALLTPSPGRHDGPGRIYVRAFLLDSVAGFVRGTVPAAVPFRVFHFMEPLAQTRGFPRPRTGDFPLERSGRSHGAVPDGPSRSERPEFLATPYNIPYGPTAPHDHVLWDRNDDTHALAIVKPF